MKQNQTQAAEKRQTIANDGGMSKEACVEYINRMLADMSLEEARLVYHFALHL